MKLSDEPGHRSGDGAPAAHLGAIFGWPSYLLSGGGSLVEAFENREKSSSQPIDDIIEAAYDTALGVIGPDWFEACWNRWASALEDGHYTEVRARLQDLEEDLISLEDEYLRRFIDVACLGELAHLLIRLSEQYGEDAGTLQALRDHEHSPEAGSFASLGFQITEFSDDGESDDELIFNFVDADSTLDPPYKGDFLMPLRATLGSAVDMVGETVENISTHLFGAIGNHTVAAAQIYIMRCLLFADRAYGQTLKKPQTLVPRANTPRVYDDESPVFDKFAAHAEWPPFGRLVINADLEAKAKGLSGDGRWLHIQSRLRASFQPELEARGLDAADFGSTQLSRIYAYHSEGRYSESGT